MEKEIMEESKIIKGFSIMKGKLTKENIKKYSTKYRVPFDYKIIALLATIISACCMLFVNAFKFSHSYDDWFVKSYYNSFGEILYPSSNNHHIFTLFQYNLDFTEAVDIFKVLTVILLIIGIIFLFLNRTKVSLAASAGMVIIMIITLFRSTNYKAAIGNMEISVLGWYYVVWAAVILGFLVNLFTCIKTKKTIVEVEEVKTTEETANTEATAKEEKIEEKNEVAEPVDSEKNAEEETAVEEKSATEDDNSSKAEDNQQ